MKNIPGEAYVGYILQQLNSVEVKGTQNMSRMLNAIRMLETLQKDIVEHKAPDDETATEETPENV